MRYARADGSNEGFNQIVAPASDQYTTIHTIYTSPFNLPGDDSAHNSPQDQPPPFTTGGWKDPVIEKAMDSMRQQQGFERMLAAHEAAVGQISYTKS